MREEEKKEGAKETERERGPRGYMVKTAALYRNEKLGKGKHMSSRDLG